LADRLWQAALLRLRLAAGGAGFRFRLRRIPGFGRGSGALAAQFLQTSSDDLEIVGCTGCKHGFLLSVSGRFGFPAAALSGKSVAAYGHAPVV
jgi:hypothetical protein